MVSISQESGENYSDEKFDRLWSAAEALGIPVSLHVAASETGFHATGNMWADFACVFTPTMYTIVSMIFPKAPLVLRSRWPGACRGVPAP